MSSIPLFYIWTAIAIFLVWHHMNKSDNNLERKKKQYYDKLAQSTASRKKEIEKEAFLECQLADNFFDDTELSQNLISSFLELKSRKLLDFNGVENTDLMIKYGTANITFIESCEENLRALLDKLYTISDRLYKAENYEKAELVLKEMLRLKDYRANTYKLLYLCYKKQGNIAQMTYLKNTIENSDLLLKKKLIKTLEEEK